MHRPRLMAVRRRILTIGVPVLWFSALLGLVSNWATEGGRRGKTVSGFLQDLPALSLTPLIALLAVTALACLALYAAFPKIMRRRLVAAMLAPGEDTQVPVRYRFDESGITQDTSDLHATLPHRFIQGLDEDHRYIFVLTDAESEPIVLDKTDLSAAQADGVREWGRAWAAPSASANPVDDTDPFGDTAGEAVRVAFALTAADRATLVLRSLDRPAMRRARIRGALTIFLGLSLIYPAIVAFSWAVDPYRVPFSIAFPLFIEMVSADFWKPALVGAALAVLSLVLERMYRHGAADKVGETLAAEARAGTFFILADPDGISVSHAGARARFAWKIFRSCEHMGDLIVLALRWDSVLPLPLRAFDPDSLARFEALAAQHLPREGKPA